MKNCLAKLFFLVCIVVSWTSCSFAGALEPVTGFDATWQVATSGFGTGSVTTQGGVINLTASGTTGSGFLGALFKTEPAGISAMSATLRVEQVSGNCELGLKATIGQIGNKRIQVFIYLKEYNGTEYIHYSVKMLDVLTDAAETTATGTIGPWDGGWVSGKPQPVAFARFGSEIWFYANGYQQVRKILLLDGIEPVTDGYVAGYVNAPKGVDASITGSISDIYLYDPYK
jgi:hypothetical protein